MNQNYELSNYKLAIQSMKNEGKKGATEIMVNFEIEKLYSNKSNHYYETHRKTKIYNHNDTKDIQIKISQNKSVHSLIYKPKQVIIKGKLRNTKLQLPTR